MKHFLPGHGKLPGPQLITDPRDYEWLGCSKSELTLETGDPFDVSGQIKGLVKWMKRQCHESVFREFFRKRFSVPATHHDPRIYMAAELVHHINMLSESGATDDQLGSFSKEIKCPVDKHLRLDLGQTMCCAHRELARTNYPTFFIDSETMQMLMKSKISDIPMSAIKWPLPAMLISLPKGIKNHGDEICNISITQTFEIHNPVTGEWEFNAELNNLLVMGRDSWEDNSEAIGKEMSKFPAGATLVLAISIVAACANGETLQGRYPVGDMTLDQTLERYKSEVLANAKKNVAADPDSTRLDEVIKDLNQADQVTRLAIKIASFMTAKEDEWSLAGETLVRPEKFKKGKLKLEAIWSPNFIGSGYGKSLRKRGYSTDEDHDGRSLRYHWRQGHFRGQHYGKNRSKYKTVFVEPYPVNAPEDDARNEKS